MKTNLKELVWVQKGEVLHEAKLREDLKFEKFRLELEKSEISEITTIGYFIRPRGVVFSDIFSKLETDKNIIIKVDDGIKINDTPCFHNLGRCEYIESITGNEITNDFQIISALDIDELFTLPEIIGNAVLLIEEDLKGNGPLHESNESKDRNVNLGYTFLNGKVCIVYLERTKFIDGGKREYHVHKNLCPRLYKPNRHIISLV